MDIQSWGYKQGLKGIRKKIEKIIKSKRLVFVGDKHVLYTDRLDKKKEYNFDQFAQVAVVVGGWSQQMATLGITNLDIVNILEELYAKQKREGK